MKKRIEKGIETLVSKLEELNTNSQEAINYTQAILNLSNALKALDDSRSQ